MAENMSNGYKFFYHYANGLHLDVYDDYIEIITGVPRSGYGGQSVYVSFEDIDSVYIQPGYLIFNYSPRVHPNVIRSFMFESRYYQYAQDTVNFIMMRKEDIRTSAMEDDFSEAPWPAVQGRPQQFSLAGTTFAVSPELDAFNTYRLLYRDAAIRCTDALAADCQARIHDLDSFLMFFHSLYKKQLDKLVRRSLNILVSQSIWTEVYDSFLDRQVASFNLAFRDCGAIMARLRLSVPADDQQLFSGPTWGPAVTGGFGPNAAAEIAPAAAVGLVRYGIEPSAIYNARVKPQQKMELFGQINLGDLLFRAYLDYWRTFLTLVSILRENGVAIWSPDDMQIRRAANVFQNLSNPSFPQDQLFDVAMDVLRVNPFNRDYHLFLINRTNGSYEAKAVADYFGYTNFNDPRYC